MTTPLETARGYLGTKEVTGPADNPKIMEMYRTIGQDWVEHDEMAWCAAFVGHCLETSGVSSTRKLNARSYLAWGEKVPSLDQAKEGDVVVLSRGNSGWQGHVAFFLRAVGQQVEVLGGNQGNGVSVSRYPKSKVLGIRRAIGLHSPPRPELRVVQQQLKDLGYYEVGNIDGSFGARTRAAVLAFRADNDLPLSPDLDPAFVAALQTAKPRAVSPERASGKPEASRILKASNGQIASGVIGVAGVAASAIAPAVETAERAKDVTERSAALLNLTEWLSPLLPWAGALIFLVVIVLAFRARTARIEDYRTGRTP